MSDVRLKMDKTKIALAVQKSMAKRYLKQKLLISFCLTSIAVSFCFILFLLGSLVYRAIPALTSQHLSMTIEIPSKMTFEDIDTRKLLRDSLLRDFPKATTRKQKKQLYNLLSYTAEYSLQDEIEKNPELSRKNIEFSALLSDAADYYLEYYLSSDKSSYNGRLSPFQLSVLERLVALERVENNFNWNFFTSADSREPENAGILGALSGSFFTLLVTFILSLPIGVGAAIYLEEFAPKNTFSRWVEININNLAAVPSIVFGLLGLSLFINVFHLPRSSSLVGGLVLSLMTLPVIIIASRAAIRAVPPSIRSGALALGASHVQVILHNILPLALPGILTGSVIGMSRAVGETAPLLLIGMVAFISSVPDNLYDITTVLPVQIYIWADSPEKSYVSLSSLASLVLLLFLLVVNSVAIYLRNKHEKKW